MVEGLNRAQRVGLTVGVGLALFAFGQWIVTVGSSARRALAVGALNVSARTPGPGLGLPGGAGIQAGSPRAAGPGHALSVGVIRVMPGLSPAAGIPAWGRMLIWIGLVAIWSVTALWLLRDRTQHQVAPVATYEATGTPPAQPSS